MRTATATCTQECSEQLPLTTHLYAVLCFCVSPGNQCSCPFACIFPCLLPGYHQSCQQSTKPERVFDNENRALQQQGLKWTVQRERRWYPSKMLSDADCCPSPTFYFAVLKYEPSRAQWEAANPQARQITREPYPQHVFQTERGIAANEKKLEEKLARERAEQQKQLSMMADALALAAARGQAPAASPAHTSLPVAEPVLPYAAPAYAPGYTPGDLARAAAYPAAPVSQSMGTEGYFAGSDATLPGMIHQRSERGEGIAPAEGPSLFCSHCGAKQTDTDCRFCFRCGANIKRG